LKVISVIRSVRLSSSVWTLDGLFDFQLSRPAICFHHLLSRMLRRCAILSLRVILSCSTCAPYLLDSLQLYFACIDNKVLIQTWNLFQLLFFDQVLWLFSHGSKEEELLKIHIETGMAIESDTLDAL
jgi:hypothetical protein